MRIAASFVPTPSSARFVPLGPCCCRRLRNSGPSGPLAATRWPSSTVSRTGSGEMPSEAREVAASVPCADSGAMKPSPRGQVAERVAAGDLAVVGEPSAAGEVERELGAVRAGDVGGVGAFEQLGDLQGARLQRVEVDRHHAREHVRADARERGAAGAGLRGGAARFGVRERAARRDDVDVAGGKRGGDRRRWLAAVVRARVHQREDRVGAVARGRVAQRLREGARLGSESPITSTLSPVRTSRQRPITVSKARSSCSRGGVVAVIAGDATASAAGGRETPRSPAPPLHFRLPAGVAQSVRAAES